MSDPIKEKTKLATAATPPPEKKPEVQTPEPPAPPNPVPEDPAPAPQDPGEAEAAALGAMQSSEFRRARKGEAAAILPMGRRIAAPKYQPHVSARYNSRVGKLGQSFILGAPDEIIKEDYRRERPGWHYTWPVASNLQTQAYINSGVYQAVPFDQIDKTNPLAAVAPSVDGNTTWMQHILVGVPPRWWDALKIEPERESIEKTSVNRAAVEAELNAQFARGGYNAEMDDGIDRRAEHIL